MHILTTTDDIEEPLFEHDLVPSSQERIEEFLLVDDNEIGIGSRRFIVLDGLVVTHRRHRILRDCELQNEQEAPIITLRFCLRGEVNSRMPSFRETVHTGVDTQNIVYDPERTYTHLFSRNDEHDVVELYLTPDHMALLAERHPELLESALAPVIRNEPFQLFPGGRAITSGMKSVIRQILSSEEHGPLRRMFIETKSTELLALQLLQDETLQAGLRRGADLASRTIDRMVEARDRVLARIDDPPTLVELARQVGTNEFALKRDFKAVFGTTVYGLLSDYKMEHARALLLDTDRSIGDIARESGYSHLAHFSTAFKKKFGMSPSLFRKAH